jgi:hypothetical protein
MASAACCHASVTFWRRVSADGDVEVHVVWCTWGMCPMMSSNGAFLVVALGHELWAYCASGSQDTQSFCWKLVKMRRYCSSH